MVQYGVPEIRCHIACPRESLRALRPRRTRRPSAPSTAHQGTLGAETAGAPRPAGLPVHASLYKGLLGLDTRCTQALAHPVGCFVREREEIWMEPDDSRRK